MALGILKTSVKTWLKQKDVTASDEWIAACSEFVLEEQNLHARLGSLTSREVRDIQNEVYQQWLHSDLKEIGTSVLPSAITIQSDPDPKQRQRVEAGATFAVQLEWIMDTASPAYAQLLKAGGKDSGNAEVAAFSDKFSAAWEPKKKRALKFELHDGSRSVYGFEWKTLNKLHERSPPGLKLLIVGPVNIVRGGTLFLTNDNLRVLGGDVESMTLNGDPHVSLLASRLRLRPDDLKKRFPHLAKGDSTRYGDLPKTNNVLDSGRDVDGSLHPKDTDAPRSVKTECSQGRSIQAPTLRTPDRSSTSSNSARPLDHPSLPRPPSTPAEYRVVLNELFGDSQDASSANDDGFDDEFDDAFPPNDELFEKIDAIERRETVESKPQIKTTMNLATSSHRVSTNVRLQNFTGELDISRAGDIKLSTSPREKTAVSSRGMALAVAASSIPKPRSSGHCQNTPPSSVVVEEDSPDFVKPWSQHQPPTTFQHDPLFELDRDSSLGRAGKRKSNEERCRLNDLKRVKVEPQMARVPSPPPIHQEELQFDAFTDELAESSHVPGPSVPLARPFRYISELRGASHSGEEDPFWCKCFIVTFLGKFRSDADRGFHIDVKLCDGASTIAVRVADEACAEFLGFNARDFLIWKASKAEHASSWSSASKKLIEFNRMLMHVNALFRLQKITEKVNDNGLEAMVLAIKPFSADEFIRLHDFTKSSK